MWKIKKIAQPYYVKFFIFFRTKMNGLYLIMNYLKDYQLYRRYSIVFQKQSIENKEADIIINYHSLEKGLLFKNMKKGFASYRISNLHELLKDQDVIKNSNRSQIKVGYQIMCKYYELHQKEGYNIEELFNIEQYEFYKSILKGNYDSSFNGIVNWSKEKFFKVSESNFLEFAYSRKSTREFTGQKISIEILHKVIELANTAPSVCNRQASNIYLLEDKLKIDGVLKIQGGFTGYSDNVNQLLILTNDRKYYYTVGERNQLYIDGGIFLMNLLYSLHYYKIGNCPINWGKTYKDESDLAKIITIPKSEKIICLIPIGELESNFRTTFSQRRLTDENFIKLG